MYTVQYYDLVLLGVIAPILVAAAVAAVTAVQVMVAVPVAAVLSAGVIAYGLFVNGPVDEVSDLTEEVDDVPIGD